jgi:hypothetical protein
VIDPVDVPSALTTLSDVERLIYDGVYEFADKEIRPLVRQMDEECKIPRSLLDRLFALNVMGIEIPEPDGGAGGTFFHSVLAVEALSRVDPSIGVLVDVQNTLVVNALLRWGSEAQKKTWLPRLAQKSVGAYALSEAGSGSDAFALSTRATERGDGFASPAASSGLRTGMKPNFSSFSRRSTRTPVIAASPRSSSNAERRGSRLARKKTSSGFAPAAHAS